MEDIAPKLIEDVTAEFRRLYDDSGVVARLTGLLDAGSATYAEAQEYAIEVAELMGRAFGRYVSSGTLPDGKLYYNIADRLLRQVLGDNHQLVAQYAQDVQTALNRGAGIGLKAQKAAQNADRVDGLVELASNAEQYDEIAEQLLTAFENFSQNIVDETIQKNAEFHHRSGLSPSISRRSTGKCCAWCRSLAGSYRYPDVPDDVYRRHENCRCTVLYDPADGKRRRQNVWDKSWR